MKIKLLIFAGLLLFFSQLSFSIFYSLKIVDANLLINQNQEKYSLLLLQNQFLQNQLATINSLPSINQYAQGQSFEPILKFTDLSSRQ